MCCKIKRFIGILTKFKLKLIPILFNFVSQAKMSSDTLQLIQHSQQNIRHKYTFSNLNKNINIMTYAGSSSLGNAKLSLPGLVCDPRLQFEIQQGPIQSIVLIFDSCGGITS